MKDEEILDLIEQELKTIPQNGFRLRLNRNYVRRHGNWFYAEVATEPKDIRSFYYNAAVIPIEEELEKENHLHVLLVPALVD